MLLLCIQMEGEHSPDEKAIGCHSMFERMIRQEIDGGVGCDRFSVNANFKVGWVPGYREV